MQIIVLVSNIPRLVPILTVLVKFVLFCFVLFVSVLSGYAKRKTA